MTTFTRRNLLRGVGGVLVPLPVLGSLESRAARPPVPHPLVLLRQANGVAQGTIGLQVNEPDRFWPTTVGPLTAEGLAAQTTQSLSLLSRHASNLLPVRGTSAVFPPLAELHAQAGNQLLTAMQPGPPTHTIMTYGQGESVDNLVARLQPDVNGGEPLTLFTGGRMRPGHEILSYRGPDDLRAAEDDPWSVYHRLLGGSGTLDQRRSANDFVLDQLNELARGSQLSAEDRVRLERHTDSMRDFELLCARLTREQEDSARGLSGLGRLDEHRITMARLFCDVIALCLECDIARAVTLQIGDRVDLTCYEIDGVQLRQFHSISHREQGSLDFEMHRQIDRLLLGEVYLYLLDRLAERGLLERSVVVWVSELATGDHSTVNLPWVIAGAGDGTLRTGEHVNVAWQAHNKMLNTLITATGLRAAGGGPWTTFGHPDLEPGLLDAIVSPTAPL